MTAAIRRARTLRSYLDWRAELQPESVYLIAPETGRTLTCSALIRLVNELPKGPSGKVQRLLLLEL